MSASLFDRVIRKICGSSIKFTHYGHTRVLYFMSSLFMLAHQNILEFLYQILFQLPSGPDLSLADVFGHLERNRWICHTFFFFPFIFLLSQPNQCWYLSSFRNRLGIAEYSISQSTLETIFNHFAANSWDLIMYGNNIIQHSLTVLIKLLTSRSGFLVLLRVELVWRVVNIRNSILYIVNFGEMQSLTKLWVGLITIVNDGITH